MSAITDLISRLCPQGVEFQRLGEIGQLVRGNGMPKSDFTETGVGCIHYGQIYTCYGTWASETISFVASEKAARLAKVDPGDLIITNTSENIEDVCKAVAWLGESQIVTGGHATVLKHNQDARFLAYYLQTPPFAAEKRKLATGTKVIDVSANSLAKIPVPTPPLGIQREIVRILDHFTELEAELAAELEARRLQFDHYRASLFSSTGPSFSSSWTTLGEICLKVTSGGTPLSTNRDYYGGDVPWLRTQEVRYADIRDTEIKITPKAVAESSASWVPENSVIVAISGAGITRGRVAVNKIPLTTNQHCCALQLDPTRAHVRFVYHWLVDQYHELRSRGQGNRSDLNLGIIKDFPIQLPLLAEQEHIASILDKFDALVNDLSIGLPAELAARRRQYEYYRDHLLSFSPLG